MAIHFTFNGPLYFLAGGVGETRPLVVPRVGTECCAEGSGGGQGKHHDDLFIYAGRR